MLVDVRRVDHTGITVSDLGRAVALWRDVLGFEVTRTFELTGEFAATLTGQPGAHTEHAVLACGQQLIELIEYVDPAGTATFRPRPCDVGSVHVALMVADIRAAIAALSAAGCTAVGEPAAIPDGARRGSLFAYVQDPDGVTVELIELIPQPSQPEDPS
jgi:catechol 2,3-dioxygenase-like lactoylglutathione lyase family enzyme